jgi:hypothetical protein
VNRDTSQTVVAACPAPANEPLSQDFELRVGGQAVPVYSCRVSAWPINQLWPGYQRPLDQTELASFAYWDQAGPAEIEVVSRQAVKSVVVRPLSRSIQHAVDGNRIRFRLAGAGQVVVEVNGYHQALHLFANPPAAAAPAEGATGVLYFGPGVHRPGKIHMESNQTVYVAPGAVVYGAIEATGKSNLRILGRGILDASGFERGKGGGCIRLSDCRDVTIEGVILRDPDVWCLSAFGCSNLTISNVKLIGLWRYNSDGIDLCNCQDAVIRDCFVRAYDDNIVIKGIKGRDKTYDDRPVRNVLAERCVLWNDWGRALEIGAETCAPEISGVTFRDCDIIRPNLIAMDIQHSDRAMVKDILFENIRIEIDDWCPNLQMQKAPDDKYVVDPNDTFCPRILVVEIVNTMWGKDKKNGSVRNITFRDIRVTSAKLRPESYIRGMDDQHTVEGVTIEDLRVNGRVARTAQDAGLTVGPFAKDVRVVTK